MFYLELSCYLLIIILLLSNRKIYHLLSSANTASKIFGSCLIILLIFAQVYNKPDITYPLTHWGMYSSTYPAPSYMKYQIELTNGVTKHYPIEKVCFTSSKAFMVKMRKLLGKPENKLLSTVESLIAIYENNHPDHSIKRFAIVYYRFQPEKSGDSLRVKK